MQKLYIQITRICSMALYAATLVACATATPFKLSGGLQDSAVVSGSAPLSFLVPMKSDVDIESVNGIKLKASETSVRLPPGAYNFSVSCTIFGPLGSTYVNSQVFEFDVETGHQYQFDADLPDDGSNKCASYVYDSTGGRHAYSETVDIKINDADKNFWKSISAGAHAGHTLVDYIPKEQSKSDWQQMLEIESWSKLMFPGNADGFFKKQSDNAKIACPDTQINVISETANDVIYEFKAPNTCTGTGVRLQLGRFITGKYSNYHAAFISRTMLDDTENAKWLELLRNATVVEHQ